MEGQSTEPDRDEVLFTFWHKAQEAVAQNRQEEARAWMEGIVELDDANIDAWLQLADLIPDTRERMQCYARVLELAPGNPQAKAGLRQARRRG